MSVTTLRELIDENVGDLFDLNNVYAVVFVANAIKPDADVVRGVAVENVGTRERQAVYFSDINQDVKEYENLPDFLIQGNLTAKTALDRFVVKWPINLTLVGTNVNMWLKPLVRELGEKFEFLKGRNVDIVDLGQLMTVTKPFQVRPDANLSKALPPSKFSNRSGSLNALCTGIGVYRKDYPATVYAEARAQMLAEAVRRCLDKIIEVPER